MKPYRTRDLKLPNSDGKVYFYNLAHIKRNPRTKYFESERLLVVLQKTFLGDREERLMLDWLITDRATFLGKSEHHNPQPIKDN